MPRKSTPTSPELPRIHTVRGQRVMLDSDLARLYEVPTKVFNQTIQRNAERFPDGFAFQITVEEVANLRSQIVTSSSEGGRAIRSQTVTSNEHGGRRYRPWVFTEHGAIMAATILRSPRAVAMSIYVVRAFVEMRDALLTNATILKRLAHGVRQHGDGVARPGRAARNVRVRVSRSGCPLRGRRGEQIDKKLLEHDLVLQDVVEKLLPLLNPSPEPEKPRRRIGFLQD